MTTFIKIPFAASGDKVNPPDTDAAGGVNWTQGYPAAYSKDPAIDPSAKRIEREDFNGILNRLSMAINEIQENGVAPWIAPADNGGTPYAYSKGIVVSYNGSIWGSLVASNTTVPTESANWSRLATQADNLYGYKFNRAINYEASATYTVPAGVRMVRCIITGGGGGGSGCSGIGSNFPGGGGGGAAATLFVNIQVTGGDTLALTVGTGGNGSPGQAKGGAGGITRITYKTNVYEAGGGEGGGWSGAGGAGNPATSRNGALGIAGGDGSDGNGGTAPMPGNGGASYWGGGGRAAAASTGYAGKAYGSGGGGAYGGNNGTNYNGNSGRDGVVYIEEYY